MLWMWVYGGDDDVGVVVGGMCDVCIFGVDGDV